MVINSCGVPGKRVSTSEVHELFHGLKGGWGPYPVQGLSVDGRLQVEGGASAISGLVFQYAPCRVPFRQHRRPATLVDTPHFA